MMHKAENRVEQNAMHLAFIALSLYAFWTAALQMSTFLGVSWAVLTRAAGWLLLPIFILTYWISDRLAKLYASYLPEHLSDPSGMPSGYVWLLCLGFIGFCVVFASFEVRYTLFMLSFTAIILFTSRKFVAKTGITILPKSDRVPSLLAYLCLIGLAGLVTLLVLTVNRSDFDDAEYIQFALQTLRHPERAPNTFDSSLGIVLEQFRFAPYRITSYETFIAVVSQWTGLNILDVYYLLVPSVSATLSILVAFLFARWFLPLRWSLLAIGLSVFIAFAWGETHVAYGNRMYVRLFQGKGLLVAVTTPLTVIMALLWMRKPSLNAFFGLLVMQVVAVGVSSSGLVITLFATALGLLSGFMAQPRYRGLLAIVVGGITLAYPISLGLWIKYASSASEKIAEIGSYLPINGSLGGTWREALALAIMITAVLVKAGTRERANLVKGSDSSTTTERTYFWLVFSCFALILNPFFIKHLVVVTSKNMSWRLAWAAPILLLLAISLVYLLHWARQNSEVFLQKSVWILPIGLLVAFATVHPWALAETNQVRWGAPAHKVPPEYYRAVELAQSIRQQTPGQQEVTVLVEPRVGTWLTVVAPDFKLIMPGHGYPITLQTIMNKEDFEQRNLLVSSIDAIAAGDHSLNKLLDSFGVNVIAVKLHTKSGTDSYSVQTRSIDDRFKKASSEMPG
jgi:hypothetical protein